MNVIANLRTCHTNNCTTNGRNNSYINITQNIQHSFRQFKIVFGSFLMGNYTSDQLGCDAYVRSAHVFDMHKVLHHTFHTPMILSNPTGCNIDEIDEKDENVLYRLFEHWLEVVIESFCLDACWECLEFRLSEIYVQLNIVALRLTLVVFF